MRISQAKHPIIFAKRKHMITLIGSSHSEDIAERGAASGNKDD